MTETIKKIQSFFQYAGNALRFKLSCKEPMAQRINFLLLLIALILLFVWQNIAFNDWSINMNRYALRLSWVSFSLGALLYGPAVFLKRKRAYAYLFVVACFVSIIFSGQLLYFEYANAFLQASAIKYASQTAAVAGTIRTLINWRLLFFASNILITFSVLCLNWKQGMAARLQKKERLVALVVLITIIVSGYLFLIYEERKEWSNANRLYKDLYDLNALVAKIGIVNFSIEDAIKYALRNDRVSDEDISLVKKWQQERTEPAVAKKYYGMAKNKNIIFIQIESLENAVINQKINDQEITPNLNRLSRESLYFDNYYSEVGPGNTADAEFVILNSLYALSDNVAFIDYAKNQYNALPQLLRGKNYHTYVLHGDVPTFWNRSNIYPGLGYERWIGKSEYKITRSVGFGPSDLGDEDFFNQSVSKLADLPQPFMATLITLSSHTPFELPDDLRSINTQSSKLNYIQQRYLESIHYTDQALGDFINELKRTEIYKNSIFVIYGDHQSYTGIAEALGPNSGLPDLNRNRIPLMIFAPGTDLRGVNHTPASHLDLYPTIANLLGINAPADLLGQDILNASAPVVTHRNSITGTINTILTPKFIFKASTDGIYYNGSCLNSNQKKIPLAFCQKLYNQQAEMIKISDLIVRGDLLPQLNR